MVITSLVFSTFAINPVKSEAASSQKTITVTLDSKAPLKTYKLYAPSSVRKQIDKDCNSGKISKTAKNYEISVRIEVVKISGKAKKKDAYFLSGGDGGCGPMLEKKWKTSDFKKGFNFESSWEMGSFDIEFDKPTGVKSVTYKVVYKSKSGKKLISKVKKVKNSNV